MNKALIMAGLTIAAGLAQAALDSLPYTDPTDEAPWLKYRKSVRHPTALVKAEDLQRARENITQYEWAAKYAGGLKKSADNIAERFTVEYLEMMMEITTAGSTTPCPACRDQGLRWLPNNNWTWNAKTPNQITCPHCHTTYPNDKYPETIKVQSKWDPRQVFTFIDVPPFSCFGYKLSRSNPSGVIRAHKLDHVYKGLNTLTQAYLLNGNLNHAEAIRRILLRFAEVTPTYLVRVGYTYNEYADCDPHEAARHIEALPVDELVAPPNIPDRKLWTGYWSASRYSTAGMDGSYVIALATAYDATYDTKRADGTPLYTEEERLKIEKDAIFEAAYLGACDTKINNKSVGNRAGVAIAGLVLGHPGMVRFGLDGFARTVESWFLPDGGTSESTSYATMTMSGIRSYGFAFRDYTEPEDYTPPEGSPRLVHFNAVRDTNYGTCWQDLIWGLQGNFSYPPIADNHSTTRLSPQYIEMIAAMLPTREHNSLLHAVVGQTPTNTAATAIYYRNLQAEAGTFALPDVSFPYLQQGFFRLGPHGRQGTAVLDASDWGNHHHEDNLNLYLWKDGHELLVDLGYLWDHPDKHQTMRTSAHNLVMIDGKDQISRGRRGSFHYFAALPHVKAMCASSTAYPTAAVYQRQLLQIDHGTHGSYWLDLFAAQGGEYRDYLFHGPNNDCAFHSLTFGSEQPAQDQQPPFKAAAGDRPWSVEWTLDKAGYTFAAYLPGHASEEVRLSNDWGQRSSTNADRGALLPYIRLRRHGKQLDRFIAAYAGYAAGREIVKGIRSRELDNGAVLVEVETVMGKDIVLFGNGKPLELPELKTDGTVAVVMNAGQRPQETLFLLGGTRLESAAGSAVTAETGWYEGTVAANEQSGADSWFVLDGRVPKPGNWQGQSLIVKTADGIEHAYPIMKLEPLNDKQVKIYTKLDQAGFIAREALTWRLPSAVEKR